MQQVTSVTYHDLFCLICQRCHTQTRNEYLGAYRFRVTCLSCRETKLLTFDYRYWSGLPP